VSVRTSTPRPVRILTCPVCGVSVRKKFVGLGWHVIPRHTRPDSEIECHGGDIRRQRKGTLLGEIAQLKAEIERRKRMELRLAERIYLAFEVLSRLAERKSS
jgi:hypothetical protein